MAKKKKRRLKKKYRILRGIYIAVVVIAAIIVIAYAALKFTVRAPEIKQPDDTGSQTSQEIVPGMTTGDHNRPTRSCSAAPTRPAAMRTPSCW